MTFPPTATDVPALLRFRRLANWLTLVLLWLYVPAVVSIALLSGMDWRICLGTSLIAAIVPSIATWRDPQGLATRLLIAIGLMSSYDALIYATSYTAYQLDAHMMYFVVESLLLAYFCWITLLVACLHTAIQHLMFNLFLPYYLYPGGTNWARFGYHAFILILQLSGLLVLAIRTHRMFSENHAAIEQAKRQEATVARLRAEQDTLKAQAESERKAAMLGLGQELDKAVRAVADTVGTLSGEMQSSAESMAATAEETTQRTRHVAAGAEQASANVRAVAGAAEELLGSIGEIGRQMSRSTAIAGEAATQVTRTNATVEGLASAVNKIGEIVSLINSIAGQTNLLALNATIEAARAGDTGKGFAVVASEVKQLANQTAKATEEIAAQVAQVQGSTGETVEAIRRIGQTIAQMNEIAATIAVAVDKQGSTTEAIAGTVAKAAHSTDEIFATIGGVNDATAHSVGVANGVVARARDLSHQSETLRREIVGFIAAIKAAA